MNEIELFAAAIAISDPAARAALLDRECAQKPQLRERLALLLKAHENAQPLLDGPSPVVSGGTNVFVPVRSYVGDIIAGRYKLLEEIGEGGMGTVWMAEQRAPVKRLVAIKLIKAGMDSKSVLARFEAERQALALMDHPNIAKVLDGGATEEGRPFFVMELVKGLPLTEYCDARKLPINDRLNLFTQICSAVQHAHQKAVIHRDLKPTNILVTEHDGKPVPKVIDFGLAKALHAHNLLTDRTLHTAFGTAVGTPLYMAPEQVGINALDVDTRTDIYALGAILYELLTGSTPLEKKRFKEAAWDEVGRLIREEEPPVPSKRVSTSEQKPTLSANRNSEPLKLTKLLRGELDWIVMKALEKDRSRRYETANGLSLDVQRFISGEPVLAVPPSTAYRLRKFIRRNRPQVIGVSLVLGALLVGVIGTGIGLIQAQKAKLEAEQNLAFAKKGNEILGNVFASLDPKAKFETAAELRNALKESLSKAVNALDAAAIGNTLDVAAMQHQLGVSLRMLGDINQSIAVLEKALAIRKAKLGLDNADTLMTMHEISEGYFGLIRYQEALEQSEEIFAHRKVVLGPYHADTLFSMNNIAVADWMLGRHEKSVSLFEELLPLLEEHIGPEADKTIYAMGNLGANYVDRGQIDRGIALLEKSYKLHEEKKGPNHPDTLDVMSMLANAYRVAKKVDRALALADEGLKRSKARFGADNRNTLDFMVTLVISYSQDRQFERAIALGEEALPLCKAKLSPEDPLTYNCNHWLAEDYQQLGQNQKAIPYYEEVLRWRERKFGREHDDTIRAIAKLGAMYYHAKQYENALPHLKEAYRLAKSQFGPNHSETLGYMKLLAASYQGLEKVRDAIPILQELLAIQKANPDTPREEITITMQRLGKAYFDIDQFNLALPLFKEVYEQYKIGATPALPAHVIECDLGRVYYGLDQPELAMSMFRSAIDSARKLKSTENPSYASSLAMIGADLIKHGQPAEAEPYLRECLEIRKKIAPDIWSTFSTMSMLGEVLLSQKKYIDAEPLLLKGYEGMKSREAKIPPKGAPNLPKALDRLIELYKATSKPDEQKKYEELRSKYPIAEGEKAQ